MAFDPNDLPDGGVGVQNALAMLGIGGGPASVQAAPAPLPPAPPPPAPDPTAQAAQIRMNQTPLVGPVFQAANMMGGWSPQDVAMGALNAFSVPGNLVRGAGGVAAQAIDRAVPWGNHSLQELEPQKAFDEAMYRGVQQGSGDPFSTTLRALPKPFAQFITAQLFDPLNAVGMGLPGQALKAGKLARAGLSREELASAAAGLGKTPDELLAAFASAPGRGTRSLEILDAFEGKTQEAILAMFKGIPRAVGKAGEAVPFHREVVGGVNPDLTANIRQSENLTDYATSLSKRAYLKQFEGGLTEALAHYKARGGDFGEIDPSMMPSELGGIFTPQVQAGFGHHVRALGHEREALEKMFGEVWSARNNGAPFDPAQFPGTSPLEKFSAVLDSLGVPPGASDSTVDLLKRAQTHLSDQDWNKFDKTVKSYPAGDILKDNPLDLVLDRVVRDRATSLGMKEPTGIQKGWETGTALFTEQALQSINYLLTNALGGTAMGALEGVSPFKVARGLSENFIPALKGEQVYTSGTKHLAASLGLLDEAGNPILPSSVSAAGAGMLADTNPTRAYTGTGLTASQRIGTPILAGAGGAIGAASGYVQSPDDATTGETTANVLTGLGAGAVAGGSIPTLSKYLLQRFSRGIEDVMRQSAWELGTRRGVAGQQGTLEDLIRQAYTDGLTPASTTPGVNLTTTPSGQLVDLLRQRGIEPPMVTQSVDWQGNPVQAPDWLMIEGIKKHALSGGQVRNPNGRGAPWLQGLLDLAASSTTPGQTPNIPLDDVLRNSQEAEGLFSPDTMTTLLRDMVGLSDEAAQTASNSWRDTIHSASRSGADLSNTIHFDYSQLNNLEEMVRQVVPFSTWSMKAFPFFARHIAENPAILTSALELRRQSENMRDETGLTSRVQGSLPMGEPMDAAWSMMLGRPVDTYTNPLRGLVPFSDTLKNLESVDDLSENPIAAAYKTLTAFGPGAHPAIEFMMRTAGILGTDTPAKSLTRSGAPIQGLTTALGVNRGRGVNPEAALQEGEGALREALSGREVTDLSVTAAERRVDELALKETGKPITSGDPLVAKYLQAKSNQKGPVWDQAMKDVMRERGTRAISGWVSGQASPTAIVSKEEAQIRGARADLLVEQELSTRVRELSQKTPTARVSESDLAQVREIVAKLPPDSGVNPEHVQTVLAQPVAANVNWLFRAIYEYQQEKTPEVSAYSGAGSPEQRRLSAQLGQYRNLAASIPELQNVDPEQVRAIEALAESYQNIPPDMRARTGGATAKLAQSVSQRRSQFRQANPDLDQYLSWLSQRKGQGSVEDYTNETAGRR